MAARTRTQTGRLADLAEADHALNSALHSIQRSEEFAERMTTRLIRFAGGIAEKALVRARQNVRREIKREQAKSRGPLPGRRRTAA